MITLYLISGIRNRIHSVFNSIGYGFNPEKIPVGNLPGKMVRYPSIKTFNKNPARFFDFVFSVGAYIQVL